MVANGYRVCFWGDENVLDLVMIVAQSCDYTKSIVKIWDVKYTNKKLKNTP